MGIGMCNIMFLFKKKKNWVTTCLRTFVGRKQGYAPSKICLLHQGCFSCQSHFIVRLLQGEVNLVTPSFVCITRFKTMVSVCHHYVCAVIHAHITVIKCCHTNSHCCSKVL